jgi:isoquinoline 1-oxidoreductase beta subunit
VPVDHVDTSYAGSHEEMRDSFGMQITGGSTSTTQGFGGLRHGAAAARAMLIGAAAQQWGVAPSACSVKEGRVIAGDKTAGYGELTKAAARIAVPAHPQPKQRKDYTLVGKRSDRVDARAKATGTAQFGIDFVHPNGVNAFVMHGPRYGAAPKHVTGEAAAKARPGVIAVLSLPFGVVVVANKFWQARAAAADLTVEWTDGDTKGLDTAEMQKAMREYHDGTPEVVDKGDAGRAIAGAAKKVEAVYEAPYVAHAAMEPNNATVFVDGNHAEVWAPTQSPTLTQGMVGHAVGIPPLNVKVNVLLAGGGFGRRAIADACAQAAIISKAVKKPVKLTWTRESDMTQGFYRPVYAVSARGGVDANGKITGVAMECLSQSIALSSKAMLSNIIPAGIPAPIAGMFADAMMAMFRSSAAPEIFSTEGMANTKYQLGNYHVGSSPVQTKLPVATWRSVGNSVTGFVMESFVDELAHAADADPFAFRRKHLPLNNTKQSRVLDALEKLSGWRPGAQKNGSIGRGMARHFAFETEVGEVAEVEIVDGRIKVRKVFCVVDCGLAVNPDIVKAQMEGGIIFGLSAALDQEITLVDGVVQQQNFDTHPLLRMFEAPEIVVQVIDSPDEPTGVGEPGLPPIAPAVANAVFALTGKRLRSMPLQRAFNEGGAA